MRSHRYRATLIGLSLICFAVRAAAAPPPLPPEYVPPPPSDEYYSPPPPAPPPPPPRAYYPPPRVVEPPRPLPPAMRIIYAPFYAAGLVLRYGFYYVVVAPIEVFGRALDYGVEGGVERE